MAALALPFSGAAETATRSAPARSPRTAFFLAPGWARTGKTVPSAWAVSAIIRQTPSNSAEPTRTSVAPSSMAASKSLDIPIESWSRARPGAAPEVVAERPQADERRPGGLGCGAERGHRHQADDRDAPAAGDRLGVGEQLLGRPAVLGRLARRVHLEADGGRVGQPVRQLVERLRAA